MWSKLVLSKKYDVYFHLRRRRAANSHISQAATRVSLDNFLVIDQSINERIISALLINQSFTTYVILLQFLYIVLHHSDINLI